MTQVPDGGLWDFSLAVYGRPGVVSACLALQERRGVDVNLLLYCGWLGASGRGRLDGTGLAYAKAAVASWHEEVVRALRVVRTRLETRPEPATTELAAALRKKVGALELEAERIEQLLLESRVPVRAADSDEPRLASRAVDAAYNLCAYLALLGVAAGSTGLPELDRQDLLTVLAGCCPELEPPALHAALAAARL